MSNANGRSLSESEADDRLRRLERRAKRVRTRLERTIDALDTRRQQVVEIGHQAKSLALPAAIGVLSVAALFGASAFAFGLAIRARRRHGFAERFARTMNELDLIPRRPSLGKRIVDKVALTVVTIAASELAKRVSVNFVDGRLPDGRLAVSAALQEHHEQMPPMRLR